MKDEKFCFKKGTGLIALVGIFLVLAVFAMNMATEQQQTTSAKAFLSCPNSALPDYTGLCPSNWIARDANGDIIKDNKGKTCCYFNVNYTGVCPSGSSPDPLGVCSTSKKTGVYITRKSDNKQVQCCNFIGTVKNTPAPVVSVVVGAPQDGEAPAQTQQLTEAAAYLLAQPINFCESIGLKNFPLERDGQPRYSVLDYFTKTCASQKNIYQWNGTSGAGAKCYSAVGVCASEIDCGSERCLRGQSNGKCLNVPVDFQKCVDAGVAQAKDAPNYTGSLCDAGATCSGGVAIGSCAPKSTKKCVCKTGMKYPTYEENPTECRVITSYSCMYGTQTVTTNSTPLKYINSTVNATKKCIVDASGKNIGYACKTDAAGQINANGSVRDDVNCKAYVSTCMEQDATWKAQKYKCSDIVEYGKCSPDKYRCGCFDRNWPTLKYDANCT